MVDFIDNGKNISQDETNCIDNLNTFPRFNYSEEVLPAYPLVTDLCDSTIEMTPEADVSIHRRRSLPTIQSRFAPLVFVCPLRIVTAK